MKITNAAADKGYDGEVQLVFIIFIIDADVLTLTVTNEERKTRLRS